MNIDRHLLEACMEGDRRSQSKLYKGCFQLLISICSRYKQNRDDCLEILNIGFLKILTNLSKYNNDVPFNSWISRIMINCLIDDYRKNKKERELIEYQDLNGHEHFTGIDWNEADKLFDAEEIELLIMTLPTKTRTVFNLYAVDGFKHREISEMLEMSENTSKWHLADARKKLQKLLAEKMTAEKSLKYGQ